MATTVALANISSSERKQLAKEGKALSDGSFPIRNESDLKNAVMAYGRASDKAKAKHHILKRAKELGVNKSWDELNEWAR